MLNMLQDLGSDLHARRNRPSFHRLLDKLPAGAYTCDAHGLITYFNARAEALWGRAPKLNDPADRYCGSFRLFSTDGSPIPHDRCWMALALAEGREYDGHDIVIERPDGSHWTALVHANPLFDDAGRLVGAVSVLVDITERKRAEDELREADRNKNEFLATLAHELRNPLAPVRNALQILQMAGDNPQAIGEARAMMERQVGHMVRLIDDLLDLSRISNGKIELRRERMDLAAALQDAVESSGPLIEEAGHRLSVSLPPQPMFVHGDRTRLAQVFSNLLNNAAKYTERGGEISLNAAREGREFVVRVRDNGIGIPRHMLPRIFEMFTQVDRSLERSRSGLGIGLGLVRGLVEMHGGRVQAISDGAGKGSEFVVRLTDVVVSFGAGSPGGDQDSAAAGSGPRLRILVVDDNRDAAVSLAMMLEIMGHETATAYDGVDAVEQAAAYRPQVVLLDIGLPRMNGYDACRRIRELPGGGEIRMIALTGWGNDEDRRRAEEAGFDLHLVKPVDPQALQEAVAGLSLAAR